MMNCNVALIVPSMKGGGEPIPEELRAPWIAKVERFMVDHFGGCSSIEGEGCYHNSGGKVDRESVRFIFAFCRPDDLVDGVPHLRELARHIGRGLVQECVAIVVNGCMEFVN